MPIFEVLYHGIYCMTKAILLMLEYFPFPECPNKITFKTKQHYCRQG